MLTQAKWSYSTNGFHTRAYKCSNYHSELKSRVHGDLWTQLIVSQTSVNVLSKFLTIPAREPQTNGYFSLLDLFSYLRVYSVRPVWSVWQVYLCTYNISEIVRIPRVASLTFQRSQCLNVGGRLLNNCNQFHSSKVLMGSVTSNPQSS